MARDTNVRTFDPNKVIITWGPIIMTGFAEGTFMNITRSKGNLFDKSTGADGSVDRINKNATDFTITVTLKQTSLSNDLLSAAFLLDISLNTGKFPFVVKDLLGTTTFFAAQAWISKDPDPDFADALSTRAWTFDTGPGTNVHGGNIL
jgi:hypothetical protein